MKILNINYLIKCIKKDSTFIPALELLSEIFLLEFKIDDAITIYKQVLELEPTRLNKITLARMYEIKQKDIAIDMYKDLLRNGEDESLLLRLANLYQDTGDTNNYIITLERIIKISPTNLPVAIYLLESYFKSKQYNNAFSLLSKIEITIPSTELASAYGYIGEWMIRDSNDIIKQYIPRYLDKVKNNFQIEWNLNFLSGYLANRIADTAATDRFFNRSLLLADSIPDVPLQISLFYIQNKKAKKGLKILYNYPDFIAANSRFSLFISLAYLDLDSSDRAIDYLWHGHRLDSNNIEILSQLGLLYDRKNLYDSSDFFYERGLKLSPNDPLINNNYAYSLSVRGIQLQRALTMIQIAISADSDNSSYLDTYGWILYKLGNYNDALEYILKVIQKKDATAEVFEHLGDIYYDMGKFSEAKDAWHRALELDPDREAVIERLKR